MSVRRASAFFLLLALFTASPVSAASKAVVFYYEKNRGPVVRLDRITPLTDGLKAILAMYALQNGAGCTGGHESFTCPLTEALELGQQCSDKHVALVHAWFKEGIPKMTFYGDSLYREGMSQDTLSSICYKMPDTATYQQKWDIIRVETSGNRVIIYAHGFWFAQEDVGAFKYHSEYEVGQGTVTIISHQAILSKKKP